MKNKIQDGAIVKWTPSGNLFQIFPRNTAFRLFKMVPLIGTIDQTGNNAGLFSFMGPKGKERIPVLLSECTLPGACNVSEITISRSVKSVAVSFQKLPWIPRPVNARMIRNGAGAIMSGRTDLVFRESRR